MAGDGGRADDSVGVVRVPCIGGRYYEIMTFTVYGPLDYHYRTWYCTVRTLEHMISVIGGRARMRTAGAQQSARGKCIYLTTG